MVYNISLPLNPERADVISMLMSAMMTFPHLRVLQLIQNAVEDFQDKHPGHGSYTDIFYTPDDIFVLALKQYMEKVEVSDDL